MTLKEQVKKFVEFDVKALSDYWLGEATRDDYDSAKFENERLSPLLSLLPEIVEALNNISECINQESITIHGWHLNGASEKATTFFTDNNVDEILAKIKEAVGEA